MKRIASCHVLVGTVFQWGVPPHLFHYLYLSGQEVSWPISLPLHSPDLTPLAFFWGFVKEMVYCEKCKMWMSCVTESSELQSILPMKCLPIPCDKLNIILMCAVPLMGYIPRSTEHIRNFMHFMIEDTWCFILLPLRLDMHEQIKKGKQKYVLGKIYLYRSGEYYC
jgi:hypothetical protein